VLIDPDVTKGLHSGKTLSLRHGCMWLEWSDYLARMHALTGSEAASFLEGRFMPTLFQVVEGRKNLFLDECSGSGCMLRGSILALTETALLLRSRLRQLYLEETGQQHESKTVANLPIVAMCMDMTGEWTFSEQTHTSLGKQRIAFSLAVPQVEAGIFRDASVARMMRARDEKLNQRPLGSVNVEPIKTGSGECLPLLYNEGIAMTSSAMNELVNVLRSKADFREFRLSVSQVKGVLDGYRLPLGGLEMLSIQRYGDEAQVPWLLVKAGKPSLAGVDIELYELLDDYSDAARRIVGEGLASWA